MARRARAGVNSYVTIQPQFQSPAEAAEERKGKAAIARGRKGWKRILPRVKGTVRK
jgi:hypothetical protein